MAKHDAPPDNRITNYDSILYGSDTNITVGFEIAIASNSDSPIEMTLKVLFFVQISETGAFSASAVFYALQ